MNATDTLKMLALCNMPSDKVAETLIYNLVNLFSDSNQKINTSSTVFHFDDYESERNILHKEREKVVNTDIILLTSLHKRNIKFFHRLYKNESFLAYFGIGEIDNGQYQKKCIYDALYFTKTNFIDSTEELNRQTLYSIAESIHTDFLGYQIAKHGLVSDSK